MIILRKSGAVTVQIDQNKVANLARRGGMVDVFTKGKAETIKVKARQMVPVKSGRLRNSIRVQQSHELSGRFTTGYEVTADTPYATFVHEGTRPHQITPRTEGGVLAFMVGDAVIFAKKVNHPGTRGQPFLLRATQAVFAGLR